MVPDNAGIRDSGTNTSSGQHEQRTLVRPQCAHRSGRNPHPTGVCDSACATRLKSQRERSPGECADSVPLRGLAGGEPEREVPDAGLGLLNGGPLCQEFWLPCRLERWQSPTTTRRFPQDVRMRRGQSLSSAPLRIVVAALGLRSRRPVLLWHVVYDHVGRSHACQCENRHEPHCDASWDVSGIGPRVPIEFREEADNH